MALTVSDISRALADCGDGVEVKADGRSLLVAQVEGTDPKFLNLVSQPEGVRVPAQPTLPEPAKDQTIHGLEPAADAGVVGNAGSPMPNPIDPAPAGDPTATTDLI